MPLSFPSASHGNIAFGFFNIDTDMLLLENYFFFADCFCKGVSRYAASEETQPFTDTWHIHVIREPERIGDLMGAIHGVRYTGFIGAVYRLFPFPTDPEGFRQKPEGYKNRGIIEEMIRSYAKKEKIRFYVNPDQSKVGIGDFEFDTASFNELIRYVWRGGYPRWRNGERPGYVMDMMASIKDSGKKLV